MNYTNILVRGTGIYHPENKINNDFFIEHFKKTMDHDISGLLNYTGRKERYICVDGSETVITMGVKAAEKALRNANVFPEELDAIIFASDTPEYTAPCNALKINYYLGAKNAHTVYDLNTNCVGMIVAVDQVSRFLLSNNKVKKALVVGSQKVFSVSREDDPMSYANFGDGASAVILEKKEEAISRGFVDSRYYTDAQHHDMALMPMCGYSKIYSEEIPEAEKRWYTDPTFSGDYITKVFADIIVSLSEANDVKVKEVDQFIFSQFCKSHIIQTMELLKADSDKYVYIGDEYGYTGVASPYFALDRALNTGRVKEGSTVVFCSVGSGFSVATLLWKF